MHGRQSILGFSAQTWTYVEAASGALLLLTTMKTAANTVGSTGVFGYGKNKKLASYGKTNQRTWDSLQALSLAIIAITMVKSSKVEIDKFALENKVKHISEHIF